MTCEWRLSGPRQEVTDRNNSLLPQSLKSLGDWGSLKKKKPLSIHIKNNDERNKMQVKELQMTSLMERGLSGEVKDFYTKFQLHFLNEKWGKVGLRNSEKMVKTQNFPPGSRISIGPKKKKSKISPVSPNGANRGNTPKYKLQVRKRESPWKQKSRGFLFV